MFCQIRYERWGNVASFPRVGLSQRTAPQTFIASLLKLNKIAPSSSPIELLGIGNKNTEITQCGNQKPLKVRMYGRTYEFTNLLLAATIVRIPASCNNVTSASTYIAEDFVLFAGFILFVYFFWPSVPVIHNSPLCGLYFVWRTGRWLWQPRRRRLLYRPTMPRFPRPNMRDSAPSPYISFAKIPNLDE